jgi:hypothetical protein
MAIERFSELGHNRPHYLFIKVIEEKENRGSILRAVKTSWKER